MKFAKVYAAEENFSGPFAKVYARKMQKIRDFFFLVKVSALESICS